MKAIDKLVTHNKIYIFICLALSLLSLTRLVIVIFIKIKQYISNIIDQRSLGA